MRKLERGESPTCLTRHHHGQEWGDLNRAERDEIWERLDEMQKRRCAYCEADLDKGQHIEHFRQRNPRIYPQGTFEWSNIFGSCENKNSCGKYKDDTCGPDVYDYRDLIKPDIDNPDDYLIFVADGSVKPRADLDEQSLKRATETIRVFNLDGSLKQVRYATLQSYRHIIDHILEYQDVLGLDEAFTYMQEEVENTAHEPFATAIRHLFEASLC